MLAELGQFILRRSATIGGDRLDQRPVDHIEIDIFERRRLVEDLVGRKCCLAHGWSWNRESLPRRDREIIGLPARPRQRKVPPLLRIVYKSSPRHHQNQLLPPAALGRGDGFRRRVRLDVGTIVAGAHVDAAVRRAKVHIGGAVAIVLGGIEGGRIVGFQIDQGEVERGAGGMAGMGRRCSRGETGRPC